jgi:carboxylesterase type B
MQTTTKDGAVRGERHGDVLRFLGVPYAKFGGRFRPAGPVDPWDGVSDATVFGVTMFGHCSKLSSSPSGHTDALTRSAKILR